MSNIDWGFIEKLEGNELIGSVPDASGSKSGVTIASGFDLGARNEADLKGLPQDIIDTLKPFLGFKGAKAEEVASNLKVSKEQANIINEFSKKEAVDKLSSKWQTATGKSFDELPREKATVVASVAFQYGDLESRTPNFWKQVTSDDWEGAVSNLRDFGDNYGTRRDSEADFFELESKKKSEDLETQSLLGDIARNLDEQFPETGPLQSVIEDTEMLDIDASPPQIEDIVAPAITPEEEPEVINYPTADLAEQYGEYTSLYGNAGQTYGERVPSQIDNPEEYEYRVYDESGWENWGAAFRQNNFIPSLMRLIESQDSKYKPQKGYSAHSDPFLTSKVGPDGLWRFRASQSEAESKLLYKRMQEDAEDMARLSATQSQTATLFTSLATPTTLAPLAPLKIMQAANRTRRFIGGGAYTAAIMAPEQLLMDTQNTQRDISHSALVLTGASLLGGSLSLAFGKRAASSTALSPFDDEMLPKSMGAAATPDVARKAAYQQMESEALVETGIGIEKVGWNPVLRLLKSDNPFARNIAVGLVDVGGMMQKKVLKEEAMEQSVETTFRTTYLSKLLDSVRAGDEAYMAYRGKAVPETDAKRAMSMMKMAAGDMLRGGSELTEVQFRHRVGMAMRRGDADAMGDAASPYVTQAAKRYRETFEFIKKQAEEVRLFERDILQKISRATDETEIKALRSQLEKIRAEGVTANNSISYLPRIYRVDKIESNRSGFLKMVSDYGRTTLRLDAEAADEYAVNVLDTVTRQRPYHALDEGVDDLDEMITPSSARARSLEIPDELLEEFLENDIEVLLRHHVKTMGMDIELTRKYGDIEMSSVIKQLETEAAKRIEEGGEVASVNKQLADDLRDVRGLRDRLRGTYGASKDPHAVSSRFVRVMKSINTLAGMGSAVVSSVPDVARLVMVEGMETAYGRGFATLISDQAKTIKKLGQRERDQAAIAVDATLGLRSYAMSDIGDIFGSRFGVERKLNQATGMFFFFNGMNLWNQALKEIAGNMTMLRMTESIMKPWSKLTNSEKNKLLKNGIDQQDHSRMQLQIKNHGQQEGKEWLPNTELWQDPMMRQKFRNALNQNVERTIITPGAGDRALWTSTEFGSMLTQFKSYGQGAMVRMLTAGLQEKDAAFWQGAGLIVGLAGIINEVKRLQYGIESNEDAGTKLINAIDRSGIGGWFTDVNNAIEKISDRKLGMRPFFTNEPSYQMPFGAKAGAVAGPTASNIINMADVVSDVLTFNADGNTLEQSRFFFPTGNLFYLDPIYDGVFGQGNVNRQ